MPSHRFDDAWFLAHRARLLAPPPERPARYAAIVRNLLAGSRLDGTVHKDTEGALRHLAPRHASAVRAHMQFYRACLETIGLVPSDAIVNAAVQIEWLWYTTPFKPFYRDHLAHVMKVALTGLWLLEDEASPLAPPGGRLIDHVAMGLAAEALGSPAIRAAASWCGIAKERLAAPDFWKAAVLETVRVAGLLHDMAYPDVMSIKVNRAATAVRARSPFDQTQEETAAQAVAGMAHHLVLSVFNQGRLPGPLPLAEEACHAAERVFRDSHSLRGAHTLLRFMETTHRTFPVDPFDAFVMEWAALAIALHDFDKLHGRPEGDWFRDYKNREAIRPCFQRDPVSYLLALADQLQDFGRMNYTVEHEGAPSDGRPAPDLSTMRVRYPCKAVVLTTEGESSRLHGTVRYIFGGPREQPFGMPEEDARKAARAKVPQGTPEPIFGESGWLDHQGLFKEVQVEVAHDDRVLTSTRLAHTQSPATGTHAV